MTVIDELVTLLGVDIKADVLPKIQKFGSVLDGVSRYMTMVSAATLAAAGSILYFTEKSASASAEISKLSQLTGVSTKNIQGMMFAIEQAGGNAESMTADIMNLTMSMSSPIPGEFNQGLFMMGVSVRKANGELKSADEVLMNVADRMQGMSAARQLQWASKIGISNDTLLLLQQGRGEIERLKKQAENIPTIVSEEGIKNSREFVTQLKLVRRIMSYIGQEATSAAGPALKSIVTSFTEWLKLNKEFIQMGLRNFVDGIVDGFNRFFEMIRSVKDSLVDAFPWLEKLGKVLMDTSTISAVVFGALMTLVIVIAVLCAKFILIAALIVAAAVAFEDFMTYLQGGTSVFGELVDWVTSLGNAIENKFPNIVGWLKNLLKLLMKVGEIVGSVLIAAFKHWWKYMEKWVSGIVKVIGFVAKLVDKMLGLSGMGKGGWLEEVLAEDEEEGKGAPKYNGRQTTNPTAPMPVNTAAITSPSGNTFSITNYISGDNAPGVASETTRRMQTGLQQTFPGGLAPVVN